MKKTIILFPFILVLLLSCHQKEKNTKGTNDTLSFFNKEKHEKNFTLERLPLGEVMPDGWIKAQMERDLKHGLVSYLDSLVPEEMTDPLFDDTRRNKIPEAESVWEIDKLWWRAEQQGYWWDGLLRNAYLTNNQEAINKIKRIINYLVNSQDENGYLGVYGPDLRYGNFDGNGELWAQARALHVMLSYYEITGEETVLDAVKKAIDRTMKSFNKNAKNPFDVMLQGGASHGLLIAEDIAWLYRITGDKKYRDYTVWLYKAYSSVKKYDNDIHYSFLSDPDEPFIGHSAHTFEHLRVLLDAWYLSGYEELADCYDNYMKKLERVILPSGAGFGFENMWGLEAHPDSTPVEYCAITELQVSLTRALQYTGDPALGDMVEKMFYNAAQGTRLPDQEAVTYCKPDNCYVLNSRLLGYYRPEKGIGYHKDDKRYKYSPTHVDVALCCAPQSCKVYPYFVSNMWMKTGNGLAAMLYGPSNVKTDINGIQVNIKEETDYPFSDKIVISVNPSQKATFEIMLRKPSWAGKFEVSAPGTEQKDVKGYLILKKEWTSGDQISINMKTEIKPITASNDEVYLQRGALVYALPIPDKEKPIRDYSVEGFHDYHYFAKENTDYQLAFTDKNGIPDNFSYEQTTVNGNPWVNTPVSITGKMFSINENKETNVKLIPIGNTVLRRVTFSVQ